MSDKVAMAYIEVMVTVSYTTTVPIYKEQNFASIQEMLKHAKKVSTENFEAKSQPPFEVVSSSTIAYLKNPT